MSFYPQSSTLAVALSLFKDEILGFLAKQICLIHVMPQRNRNEKDASDCGGAQFGAGFCATTVGPICGAWDFG